MLAAHDPRQNRLLATLAPADYDRLVSRLEFVLLPLGWGVYDPGEERGYIYFLTSGIVSLLHVLQDESTAEIAVVGREGVVGISLYMGGEASPTRAVVQSAGDGYRIKARFLKTEFESVGLLNYLLLRYTQALLTQMAQTSVCKRNHSVDQQLCRWLLLSLDCLPSNELVMTEDLISKMLGVDSEGVIRATASLQGAGVIRYSRGKITVLDRPQMETRACECYGVVKRECDRLLAPLQ
jgi:CRP-like cAMP-binding protein